MTDATVTGNVGINVNPNGLEAGITKLRGQIQQLAKELGTAGDQFNSKLKEAAIQMKRLQTAGALQNFNATQMMGPFAGDMALGKKANELAAYRQGLTQTAQAMEILRTRVAGFNAQAAQMARAGQTRGGQDYLNVEKVKEAAAGYSKINNQVADLRGRIAMMGRDGQAAMQPMLRSLDLMERANARAFKDNKRFDFSGELAFSKSMVRDLKAQVVEREKLEAKTRLNIEALRQEAAQILTNTQLQREAALAGAVRSGRTAIGNRAMLGIDEPYRRQLDLTQRLATQTNYLTLAKKQLNTEYAKPVEQQNAVRINQLLERYRALQREIGQTIALRNQEQKAQGDPKGGFFAGMKSSATKLWGGGDEGSGMFGAGALVGRVASYAVAATAIYGLISSIKDGIGFAIQFEDSLAQLQAISGSTTTEMERLSASIFQVSKSSVSSVLELTQSATAIAQAGYAGAELTEMLQSVVNLSAASGASPADAVEVLTSALGAFQISATEASRITDTLVAGLNNSKLTVQQMQLGLQYLGNTAAENNITFEELTATMATLADAGIRSGSTAATGTRQMLIDFMDPSEKLITQLTKIGLTTADIDVKVLGLSEVLTRLRDAGFQAYGTLETRASAAYTALSRNIDLTQEHLDGLNQQGIAEAAAETRAQSLAAQWQQMFNRLAEIGNELGKNFIPALKILLQVVGGLVLAFADFAATITYPLRALGLLTEETDYLSVSLQEAQASFQDAGLSAGEAASRAAEMGDSLNDVTTALKDTKAEMATVETQQASLRSETEKLIMRSDEMAGSNGNLEETTTAVSAAVSNLSMRFPGLRSEFEKTSGGIMGLISAMVALDRKAQETLRNLAQTGLAQAGMERKAALRELGGTARTLVRQRVGAEYTGRLSDPAFERKRAEVTRLLGNNDTASARRAHRIMMSDSRFQNRKEYAELTSGLARLDTAKREEGVLREQFGVADFALSRDGQRLQRNIRLNNANSTRAASQGSPASNARMRQGIESQEAYYQKLEKQYRDNPYAAGLIETARNSSRAAINRLSPEVEKEEKKARAGGGKSAAERAAAKRDRDNERREKELNRIDGRIQKEELELRKEQYENAIEAFKNNTDLEGIEDLMNAVDKSLGDWLGAEAETAIEDIKALNPTDEQRKKMLATAGRKAEELREGEINKIADTLAGVIKTYIDITTKAIERQYDEAMRFTERNVALAEARLAGLNDPLNAGKVPEYLKTLKQRDIDIAEDRNRQASMGAGERRLTELREMLAKAMAQKAEVEARLNNLGRQKAEGNDGEIVVSGIISANRELSQLDETLAATTARINEQELALAVLTARYGALKDVPTTFSGGLKMAVEALRIEIGHTQGLGQELINNLDQPLRALHEGFKGFFSDMLSGSVSVGQAFKNLAGTVIDAINQMIAVALAKQFFSLIANIFSPGGGIGGGVGGGVGNVDPVSGASYDMRGLFGYSGGLVKDLPSRRIASMYRGGSVMGGLGTRDSTLIHAAKDEFLLRRPAVQSLGKQFLHDMNMRGAAAVRDAAPTNMPVINAPTPVNTNVYLIAPEEKPQMGPNDIIATFSNDVLKGGVTKKLIKQVSSGG